MIGVRGPFTEVKGMLQSIEDFCKFLGVTINLDKTNIVNLGKKSVEFLGFTIKKSHHVKHYTTRYGGRARQGLKLRLSGSKNT
jgi:hypothetical protein